VGYPARRTDELFDSSRSEEDRKEARRCPPDVKTPSRGSDSTGEENNKLGSVGTPSLPCIAPSKPIFEDLKGNKHGAA